MTRPTPKELIMIEVYLTFNGTTLSTVISPETDIRIGERAEREGITRLQLHRKIAEEKGGLSEEIILKYLGP